MIETFLGDVQDVNGACDCFYNTVELAVIRLRYSPDGRWFIYEM